MPSFLFYVCVRFASNLCEGKLEVLSLDNTRQTRAKWRSKVLAPTQNKTIVQKKFKKENFSSVVVSLVV